MLMIYTSCWTEPNIFVTRPVKIGHVGTQNLTTLPKFLRP